MDIEPSWDLGGWFLLFVNCMDTIKAQSSTPRSGCRSYARPHQNFLLCLGLLLMIFLLHVTPSSPLVPSSKAIDSPALPSPKRLLLRTKESTSSTTNLHPREKPNASTHASKSSRRKEFGAGAHEVPSGPNPISN